jgi:hypothetical protein
MFLIRRKKVSWSYVVVGVGKLYVVCAKFPKRFACPSQVTFSFLFLQNQFVFSWFFWLSQIGSMQLFKWVGIGIRMYLNIFESKLDCGYILLSFGQRNSQVGQCMEEEGVWVVGVRMRWRRRECISFLFFIFILIINVALSLWCC